MVSHPSDCPLYLKATISLMPESPAPTYFCVLATGLLCDTSPTSRSNVRTHLNSVTLHAMQTSFIAILVIFASAVAPALSTPVGLAARDPGPKKHSHPTEEPVAWEDLFFSK